MNSSDGYLHSRVKSLSKGNISKKDPLSSSLNLRDSATFPVSSLLPTASNIEDNLPDIPNEINRFGWSKQIEKETSPPFKVDRVPSGRVEGNIPASSYSDYYKGQRGGQSDVTEDDVDYSEEIYNQEKPSWIKNKKVETSQISALEDKMRKPESHIKRRELPDFEANNLRPDDDLNALLKVVALQISKIDFSCIIFRLPNKTCLSFVLGRGRSCKCSQKTSGGNHGHC